MSAHLLAHWRVFVAGALLLAALASAAFLAWPRPTPPLAIATLAPRPSPSPSPAPMLVVHIVGAVANPGVYRVPGGSRAEDVINMAGGLTEDADGGSLNLAARVIDGQQVVVRTKAAGGIERPALDPKGKINLNLATTADLDGLPGVGPALAQRIVERRQRSGPYEAIEQLRDERILPAPTYERVKELLTVD